eukprot:COSAG02_NODE_875_length_16279_cov_199.143078_4_plen_75_part_00
MHRAHIGSCAPWAGANRTIHSRNFLLYNILETRQGHLDSSGVATGGPGCMSIRLQETRPGIYRLVGIPTTVSYS